MQGFDSWLEAPYVEAAARTDEYVDWCEREGLDADEDHWEAFDEAMADAAEAWADNEMERRAEERFEMELMGE